MISASLEKPSLPAMEVRSTRRVVPGRRRRVRGAVAAQGPQVPERAKGLCTRIRYAVEPYMVRPAVQEEFAAWLTEKLRSYIRHLVEVPLKALVP